MSDEFVKIAKAEYKRRLLLGARLECTQHMIERYVGTVRTITKVQTNGVRFTVEGEDRVSWSPFDSVSEVRSKGDEMRVYYKDDDGQPRMTLRLIEAGAPPIKASEASVTVKTPEYRDLQTLTNASIWKDRRNGASAISWDSVDGVRSTQLRKIFKHARYCGFEISRKRPLIVYGVCSQVGETATFKFVQVTSKRLFELDEEIYFATNSTASVAS